MQLITLAAAAALVATASASPAANAQSFNLNSTCIESEPKVRIFNRCPYKVYLWSVLSGMACPAGDGAVLNTGEFYQENYRPAVGPVGTSIKLSKTQQCESDKLTQLEYYIETKQPGFNYNYLDVSYVNCASTKNCPTSDEGFYLKSGNVDGKFAANSLNNICPILACSNWEECSKVAYVNWDDVQTKSCQPDADLDFYMCGGEAPSADDDTPVLASSAAPKPSSVAPKSSAVAPKSSAVAPKPSSVAPTSTEEEDEEPTSTDSKPSSTADEYEVEAAAITPAPVKVTPGPINVKTEYVYVTEIAYVNAKRHAHGHRHQHFKA